MADDEPKSHTEAARRYVAVCQRQEAIEAARNGVRIDVSSQHASLYPVSADLVRALLGYMPQIIEALAKQIAEEVAHAWHELELARREQGGLKVVK